MHNYKWNDMQALTLPSLSLLASAAVDSIIACARETLADLRDETLFAVEFDLERQDLEHGLHMMQCEIYRQLARGIPEFDARVQLSARLKDAQTVLTASMLVAVWRK